MLPGDITDQIIRGIDGLVRTDDSKVAERAIEAMFPKWRQQALLIVYNGSKTSRSNTFLGAKNYMLNTLTFDATIQDAGADYIKFEGEPPVQLSDDANGCRFIGDKLSGQNFIVLRSPSDYGVYKDAKLITLNDVCVCITGSIYKVWGNLQLKNIDLDYIAANPYNISTYDPETDDYPVSEDVRDLMIKLAIAELAPESAKPADVLADAAPTVERTRR